MQAYKLNLTIPEDHIIRLPDNVPSGRAEVIVLFSSGRVGPGDQLGEDRQSDPPAARDVPNGGPLLSLLETLRGSPHQRLSTKEIDASLAEERASWEDEG